VRQSGLSESEIRKAAEIYSKSDRTLISWCLGVTQHEHGPDAIREIVNVLLLRGNLGREGAGPSPVRGHSNVQGNRTCGIDHRPSEAFLNRLADVCKIDPPREHGRDTVATIEAMHEGSVKVFVGMGGKFVLAAPDTPYTADGPRKCELTVQVSTKLNRSHLVHGRKALILPCLGRTEKDHQRQGLQETSVEDSMSMVHLSRGKRRPASPHLLSEPAIIAGIAKATLPDSPTQWEWYVEDYDRIRDVMAKALIGFEDFNRRVHLPLGFRLQSRRIKQGSLVDIVATAKDGSVRELRGYRALAYDLPRGSAAGYMLEMNVLIGISDHSTQSDQPLMKNVKVRVTPSTRDSA
jgi:anaerobic selenocysteine-containing dehydrogenase